MNHRDPLRRPYQGAYFLAKMAFGEGTFSFPLSNYDHPKNPQGLQWKGERTCIAGVFVGPQNDARPLRGQDS